ncbi:MAG: phosphatase PAP2 family protein [Nitrososphaerota archaeon]|nr:phosphatase PAP2 family protein [Nitrososphaerota archaeon]
MKPSSMLVGKKLLIWGVVSLALFLLVAFLVFSGLTQSLDARGALALNTGLGSTFTSLMVAATKYGREYFWIGIVALMLVFGDKNTRVLAIELAALFVVGIAVGESLKLILYRARPYDTVTGIVTRVARDTDSSFPSGHALIVSIGSAFTLVKFKHKAIALVLTLEAAFVCYSRIYVGMHYPLDVAAGILIGVAIVLIGLSVIESFFMRLVETVASAFDRIFKSIHLNGRTFLLQTWYHRARTFDFGRTLETNVD